MMKSMFSGVAGLKAHQTQMDVIGNNISNVNTNGFKASRTIFRDMMYRTITGASGSTNNSGGNNPSQVGCGSQISAIDVINSNGGRVTTNRSMDTYIDGEGYFTVGDGSGNTYYSRLGALDFDADGNLVDGNGGYVMGYAPKEEKPYVAYLDRAKVDFGKNDALSNYKLVLKTGIATSVAANVADKTITVTMAASVDKDGTVNADTAKNTYVKKSDLQGALQGAWTWTGTEPKNEDASAIAYAGVTVDQTKDTNGVSFTNGKISESVTCDTTADPKKISYASLDSLTSLNIDSSGTINGTDKTSGKVVILGQLAIATFSNPNALNQMGNSYFSMSSNSGSATYQPSGQGSAGKAVGSALEGSNVDLANEFSTMILTQRGFQANSKIITVSDTMLEELVNLKR